MVKPRIIPLQADFSAGCWRDVSRDRIPANGMYDSTDVLPGLRGAALGKRAPWTYVSNSITGATDVRGGIEAPFASGDQLIVLAYDGTNWSPFKINTSNGTFTDLGNLNAPPGSQNPVFFKDTVIIPQYNLDTGVSGITKKLSSAGALADMVHGIAFGYATPYKDRVVYANVASLGGNTEYGTVFVSNANDADTVDTTYARFRLDRPITGLATLRSGVMMFQDSYAYILRGSSPPTSNTTGDMSIDLVHPVGLKSAMTLAYWGDYVIWANNKGAYMSDGVSLIDLTAAGGIKSAWPGGAGSAGYTGVVGNFAVFTSAPDPNGIIVQTTWVCYLPNRSWYRLTNYKFRSYWPTSPNNTPGLYGGLDANGRVCQVGRFDGTPGTADADGTTIIPTITTRYYRPQQGTSRMRRVYVGYVLRYASGATTYSVGYQTKLGETAVIGGSGGTIPQGDTSGTAGKGYLRKPVPIRHRGEGLWLKLTGTIDTDFALQSLELDYWPEEKYRLAN